MSEKIENKSHPSTPEFTITRVFNAAPETIYQLWTDPEHSKNWFAPKGFTVGYQSADVRVGGINHYWMASPDGAKMWGKLKYLELQSPSRIVYLQYFSDEAGGITRHPMSATWPLEMLTKIRLDPVDGKTKLTLIWTPQNASPEELETFKKGMSGMTQGWGGSFEALENYIQKTGQ